MKIAISIIYIYVITSDSLLSFIDDKFITCCNSCSR